MFCGSLFVHSYCFFHCIVCDLRLQNTHLVSLSSTYRTAIWQNIICMNNNFIYSLSMWLTWTSLTHLDYCKDVVKTNWSRPCRHKSFEHELRSPTPKYSNHNITGGFVLRGLVVDPHCIYVIYHPGSSFFARPFCLQGLAEVL